MTKKKKAYRFLLTITALMYISFGLLTSVIGVIIDRFQVQYEVSLQIAALLPVIEANGLSWNTVYLIFGIINAVLLFLLIIAKFPEIAISVKEKIQPKVIGKLLRKPIIITYAIGIFLYVGAEVGTSSYIITFMRKIHDIGVNESLWEKGSFLASVFPSVSALAVAAFWLFQAIGRLIIGPMMKYIKPRTIFITHSALTWITLLITIYSPVKFALIGFALTGYFTCASFTSIFSAAIQSFDKYHGTISGILCTAIVGGAILGFLVGFAGDILNMQVAMYINILAFFYVFSLSIWGKGKLDFA